MIPLRKVLRPGVLRVGMYAGVVFLGIGLLASHSVSAQMREASLDVGRELAELAPLLKHGNRLRINGETMFFAESHTEESYDVVLERFRVHCEKHPGSINALFPGATPGGGPAGIGTVFKLGKDEGVVMCLAKAEGTRDDLMASFRSFLATKNLGDLGMARYAYVRRPASGVGAQVLAAWTNEKFNMEALVGDSKYDAPGTDPKLSPRPPGGTRRMSALLEGSPFATYMFRTRTRAEENVAFYKEAMPKSGFKLASENTENGTKNALFLRGDENVLVTIRNVSGEDLVTVTEATSAMVDRK